MLLFLWFKEKVDCRTTVEVSLSPKIKLVTCALVYLSSSFSGFFAGAVEALVADGWLCSVDLEGGCSKQNNYD